MLVNLGEHIVEVEMLVDADNPLTAQLCAVTALRAALYMVGVGTVGWDMDVVRIGVETRAAGEMLQGA